MVHGWCETCRRPRMVAVSAATLAQTRTRVGVCSDCNDRASMRGGHTFDHRVPRVGAKIVVDAHVPSGVRAWGSPGVRCTFVGFTNGLAVVEGSTSDRVLLPMSTQWWPR